MQESENIPRTAGLDNVLVRQRPSAHQQLIIPKEHQFITCWSGKRFKLQRPQCLFGSGRCVWVTVPFFEHIFLQTEKTHLHPPPGKPEVQTPGVKKAPRRREPCTEIVSQTFDSFVCAGLTRPITQYCSQSRQTYGDAPHHQDFSESGITETADATHVPVIQQWVLSILESDTG